MVSENAIPIREYLEREGRTPAISWCGSDDWLGEWSFGLSSGSLPDEPYVLANIVAHAGHRRVGLLVEESLIGEQYLGFFRRAARSRDWRSWPRSESSPSITTYRLRPSASRQPSPTRS
jgi:hypothetical protein